ncbi:hypothetical protein [uncultured Cardiobacterium sp.]|uniref:hypothetical protein n=1 Tax=uncultured Cardiobacterium sp. TaxID=417619 RepID=UPI00261AD4F3|nr:hypothetical protein [uncultured Cardiobacterium sp.]
MSAQIITWGNLNDARRTVLDFDEVKGIFIWRICILRRQKRLPAARGIRYTMT